MSISESECAVEVGGRSGVPGTGNQRTRFESAKVAGEVGDDHFQDVIG